jgi:hypothetical protein
MADYLKNRKCFEEKISSHGIANMILSLAKILRLLEI